MGDSQHIALQEFPDGIVVTETKFTPEEVSQLDAKVPRYSEPIRLDRIAHGGEAALWCKHGTSFVPNDALSTDGIEIIWISIRRKSGKKIAFGAIVLPRFLHRFGFISPNNSGQEYKGGQNNCR